MIGNQLRQRAAVIGILGGLALLFGLVPSDVEDGERTDMKPPTSTSFPTEELAAIGLLPTTQQAPPTVPATVPESTTAPAAPSTAATGETVVDAAASSQPAAKPAPAPGRHDPPSAGRSLDAGCARPVVIHPPASDLATVVANAPAGTCFVLQAGQYWFHNVVPKDDMTFIGVDRNQVSVVGNSGTENAFHGTAARVSIGRMKFSGFTGSGGEKRQEQAAIRGTSKIWGTVPGTMAKEWLIEDVEVSGGYASGVFLGDDFTVRRSTLTNNGVTGIGGTEVHGGLIERNVISGNGFQQADGEYGNGAGIKLTQSGSPERPVVVRHNELFGNDEIAIWFDVGCNGFEVINNYIHDQRSQAVMVEISGNGLIQGNLLVNANTWSDFRRDFNAGAVTVGESRDVTVEGNFIEGAVSGVVVRQTRRPLPQESFLYNFDNVSFQAQRVVVRNNNLVGVQSMGISTGVTGNGLIPDASSIKFDNNRYSNAGAVQFWWDGGANLNLDQWRAAGRDTTATAPLPGRPAWSISS